MSTYLAKPAEVERAWYVIDAAGKPLGRVAAQAAVLLRGKHKPTFTPHVDCGDHVIIINCKDAVLTGSMQPQIPQGSVVYTEKVQPGELAEGDVIMETSSQNTIENILFALIELQRAFCLNNIRRVLLVTTAYHMRRSLSLARYLFPQHIAVLPCPANDTHTRRDTWTNSPIGIARAKKEAMKIVDCVRNGAIPDFEI